LTKYPNNPNGLSDEVLDYASRLSLIGEIIVEASNLIKDDVLPKDEKVELRKHLPNFKYSVDEVIEIKYPLTVEFEHGEVTHMLTAWYKLTELMSLDKTSDAQVKEYIKQRKVLEPAIEILCNGIIEKLLVTGKQQ